MAPIPPYPGFDGFPLQFASDGRSFRPDPNTSEAKNLNAYGLKLWNESHAVDPTLGGAEYMSSAWLYQLQQNGKADGVSVPLPFPNMVGLERFYPKYLPGATIQDFAPGEFPLSKCQQYAADGKNAVYDFLQKYKNFGDTDILPGTVITRAQGVLNVKINYNQEAQSHGCTELPFPDAAGSTTVVAEPSPVVPKPAPKPNTLNGVPLTDDGKPVTGGPYPGDVNQPVGQDTADPIGSGPLQVGNATGSGPYTNPGMAPRPLQTAGPVVTAAPAPTGTHPDDKKYLLLIAAVVLYFVARGKR